MIGQLLLSPASWILAFVSILVALFVRHLLILYGWSSKMPPGPFPLPILGNLLVFKGTTVPIYETVSKLSEKYGEKVTIWMGTIPMVFLQTYEAVREAFIDNQHDFASRPYTIMSEMFLDNGTDIIFAEYTPKWALYKKMTNRAVRLVIGNEQLEEHVKQTVEDTVDQMTRSEEPILLMDFLTNCIYNVLLQFCFSSKMSVDDPEFKRQVQIQTEFDDKTNDFVLYEAMPLLGRFPAVYRLIPAIREMQNQFNEQKMFAVSRFQKCRESFDRQHVRNISDAILVEQENMNKEGESIFLSDKDAGLILMDVFAAGVQTTSTTLQWFFLEMILNQDIQEQCYQNICSVVGDQPVSLADRARLPFVEACILETLRRHPIAAIGVPHTPTHDGARLGKYELPKETMVAMNIFQLHHDPTYWKNPENFDPSHFIDEEEGIAVKPSHWMPFGAGRRVCLGEQLAKNDLFLICSGLLQKLKFKPVPGYNYTTAPRAGNDFNMVPDIYSALIELR